MVQDQPGQKCKTLSKERKLINAKRVWGISQAVEFFFFLIQRISV
jgi:hypothetical protein